MLRIQKILIFNALIFAFQTMDAQHYSIGGVVFTSNIKLSQTQPSAFKVKRNRTLILTFEDTLRIEKAYMRVYPCGTCVPEIHNAPVIYNKNKLCLPIPLIENLYKQKFLDENVYRYRLKVLFLNSEINFVVFPKQPFYKKKRKLTEK